MAREMSEIAEAQIMVAKGGETCFYCGYVHQPGEMHIQGTSLDDQLGYIGGIFCLEEWLATNDHPHNREVIAMEQQKPSNLGVPKAKPFGKTKAGRKDWDCVHSELLGKDFLILSAEPCTTQYGQAYVVQVIVHGEARSVLFGGSVLISQIADILDELPVAAHMSKPTNYYLLEDQDHVTPDATNDVPF